MGGLRGAATSHVAGGTVPQLLRQLLLRLLLQAEAKAGH